MVKQLFLIRHAESQGRQNSASLTENGIKQCHNICMIIKKLLNSSDVEIYHSSHKNATETAKALIEKLSIKKSWSSEDLITDINYTADYDNLHKIISLCKSEVLIIVGHLEYVWYYPEHIGFKVSHSDYCEGVLLQDKERVVLSLNSKTANK